MTSVRLLLLAALATLGVAGPASAASFYVDDNGAGPPTPGCQDAGHPCATINAALTASRALAGTGDTINVASGTYAEDLALDQPADNGLTIAGSNSLLSATKIQAVSGAAQAVKLGSTGAPLNSGQTLSGLTVVVPAGADPSQVGVAAAGVDMTLSDLSISMAE